jgi:hypothetical protein
VTWKIFLKLNLKTTFFNKTGLKLLNNFFEVFFVRKFIFYFSSRKFRDQKFRYIFLTRWKPIILVLNTKRWAFVNFRSHFRSNVLMARTLGPRGHPTSTSLPARTWIDLSHFRFIFWKYFITNQRLGFKLNRPLVLKWPLLNDHGPLRLNDVDLGWPQITLIRITYPKWPHFSLW